MVIVVYAFAEGPHYAWMGDLLIVKHQKGSTHQVEDMTPEDHVLVDVLIKWCTIFAFMYNDTRLHFRKHRKLSNMKTDLWWGNWMAPFMLNNDHIEDGDNLRQP